MQDMTELKRIHILKLLMVLFKLKSLKKLNTYSDCLSSPVSFPAVEDSDFYSAEIDFIL